MDLISDDNALDLFDEKWKIYTRMESYPPQYLAPTAKVSNSLIDEGCEIQGEVRNSVIFSGVKIGKNSKVIDSVIMKNSVIEDDVVVEKLILANDVRIKKGTKLQREENIQVIPSGEIVGGGDNDAK
ncbi:MAG: glucose-1-phosphate adenylyltransferase, partial [Fusobacteriaceae bacterium]